MNWTKYTIHTTVAAEDEIAALLNELEIEGIEIDDALPPTAAERAEMFLIDAEELEPELPPADGTARISFYLREPGGEEILPQEGEATDDSYTIHDRSRTPEEQEALLKSLREGLTALEKRLDIGEGRIEVSLSREEDWRDNWKESYKPFLMDDILVKPSWEPVPEIFEEAVEDGTVKLVEMDPGTAFGTGTHESTRLVVNALKKYMLGGDIVTDIGTGSGILGYCALARGAGRVNATELDPVCEHVIAENMALNGLSGDQFRLYMGNVLTDEALRDRLAEEPADILTANILAQVIIALAEPGQADRLVRPGGVFISSGIIASREEEVRKAIQANPAWEYLTMTKLGDWCCLVAGRKIEEGEDAGLLSMMC